MELQHRGESPSGDFSWSSDQSDNGSSVEDFDRISYQEYCDSWFSDHEIVQTNELMEEQQFFSADLTEATYNLPFKVIELQNQICDEIMADFIPWQVFSDLFKLNQRQVDMSDIKALGLWDGDNEVTSTRGTFMGDGMSFIHLTLVQVGNVGFAFDKEDWPTGQSIGDDLVLLKAKLKHCLKFCWQAEELGMVFSKLNAINNISCTLCESYAAKISNQEIYEDLNGFRNCFYNDLMHLDVIKGSILSGRSKVKKDGVSPFIGHAKAASQQARWHPILSTRSRSKTLLWASNFHEAKKLGSSMASLPRELGGLDMLIGNIIDYHEQWFQREKLPYYEAMLRLEYEDFLKYSILLQGVYRANPKGFAWENNFNVIQAVCSNIQLIRMNLRDNPLVPEEIKQEPALKILHYLEEEHDLVTIDRISEALARREAHKKIWDGKITKSFMTLKISNVKERANKAWAIIKSNLDPIEPSQFKSRGMSHLAQLFRERSWGVYASREDKAIDDVFEGMPSLWLVEGELSQSRQNYDQSIEWSESSTDEED